MAKAPIIIGIPPGKRQLWIERHSEAGFWLIPLSTSRDRKLGDFLRLYNNGTVERVTIRPDDDNVTVLIKPADKFS